MNKSFNVFSRLRIIFAALIFSLLAYLSYSAFSAYKYSRSSSPFELAAQSLGSCGCRSLQSSKGQEDLLCVFYLNGSFDLETVWQDLHRIGHIKDTKRAFQSINKALHLANFDRKDPLKVNFKSLRKNFLKDSGLDVSDAADLILYMSQNSFNRKAGQERYEINLQKWPQLKADLYLKAAKGLNLVERIHPKQKLYHQCWVCGESRPGLFRRLIDVEYIIDQKGIKIADKMYILTGDRELWANIDGIEPSMYESLVRAKEEKLDLDSIESILYAGEARTLEGKEYIEYLARNNGIILNSNKPFVSYETISQCPDGRFPGRDYPNYQEKVDKRLNEALMAKDLLNKFFSKHHFNIIDSSDVNGKRPDTVSTAAEAARILAMEISEGKFGEERNFAILHQSNNPFVERQTLVAQKAVDEAVREFQLDLKGIKITVEGVGFACKDGPIDLISAELASLISEKWKLCNLDGSFSDVHSKRDIEDLLFQKRNNDILVSLPCPTLHNSWSLRNTLVSFWDNQ